MDRNYQPGMGELLGQDEVWYGRQGDCLVPYRLDEMTSPHLVNTLAWLMRHADSIHLAAMHGLHQALSHVNGEQAEIELDLEFGRVCEMNAREWMESQPLVEGITRRLADRLEETHGG